MSARRVRVLRWGWLGLADRRRRQPIDRAVAWWLWNYVSGARLGTGPAISKNRGPVDVLWRVVRAVARLAAAAGSIALSAQHAVFVATARRMQHPRNDYQRWRRDWSEINRLVTEINRLVSLLPRPK